MPASELDPTRGQRLFTLALAAWLLLSTGAVTLLASRSRVLRAVIGMGWGLILLWVFGCGALMWRFRQPVREWVLGVRLDWRLKFVLFATALALLEEAITTGMTDLAPLFGVRFGEAYVTASGNYLDVVLLHSVILFVSMFVGWAWLLSRYDFRPFTVALLFGMTGTLAETIYGGPRHLLEFGMWAFVYGWMVFLPAYSIPLDRGARPPKWWHYPFAVLAPFAFLILFPIALVPHLIVGKHPDLHFPPMRP